MLQKYLMPFTELPKSIVPASLLCGLCWLVGNCWALGFHSFGYISPIDIIRSSLMTAPILAIIVGIASFIIANGRINGTDELKKQNTINMYFLYVSFSIFILLYISKNFIQNDEKLRTLNTLLLIPLYTSFLIACYNLGIKIRENKINEEHAITIFYGLISFLAIISSYSINQNIIFDKKIKYNEKICTKTECWNGRTISKFSEATYFIQQEKRTIIAVMNSEIINIKYVD